MIISMIAQILHVRSYKDSIQNTEKDLAWARLLTLNVFEIKDWINSFKNSKKDISARIAVVWFVFTMVDVIHVTLKLTIPLIDNAYIGE